MDDVFQHITRDDRQSLSIKKWAKANGRATIEGCTGYGKSYIGYKIIDFLLKKQSDISVLIVVPTDALKIQWEELLKEKKVISNCTVKVINSVVKENWNCTLLIIDECHRYCGETFSQVFDKVKYKLILGLTATIERLDGKEEIIKKHCPVVDTITLIEAMANGWVAPYKEYQVILHVDDIDKYLSYQREFQEHFEFFNYKFDEAMSMLGPKGYINRIKKRDELYDLRHKYDSIKPSKDEEKQEKSEILKSIMYHATAFSRVMQARKSFINNHPKKLEIARKIIEARPFSQIITFSNNVKMAESIGIGSVYSGKDTKKKGRATLEQVNSGEIRVLNTIQKCNEGISINNLSVAVMLGIDSSKIKAIQRVGRILRLSNDKQAEVFNLVIDQTTELEWFRKSHTNSNYITIDEEGLNDVLEGKTPKPYKKKLSQFTFRF